MRSSWAMTDWRKANCARAKRLGRCNHCLARAIASGWDLSTGGEPEPAPTPEEFEHDLTVIKRGLAHLAKHGLTSFHNMDGNLYQLQLLEALEARGELTARARIPFHFKNFMEVSALEKASEMSAHYHSDRLASGFVKLFVDGVLDSWTAVMVEDYADRKGWVGEPLFTKKQFAESGNRDRQARIADRRACDRRRSRAHRARRL